MDRIKGRPLVLFGAVFLPSVALFFFVQMRVRLLCAVICVLLLLFPLLLRRGIAAVWPKRLLRGGRAVFSGLLCGSLLAAAWFFFSFSPWEQDFGQTVFVQGTVTEISYVSDYSFSATLFTTKTPRGIGASFLTLRGEFSPSLCVGDRVTVSGILSSFSEEPKRYTRLTALGQGKAAIYVMIFCSACAIRLTRCCAEILRVWGFRMCLRSAGCIFQFLSGLRIPFCGACALEKQCVACC